MSRNSIDLIFQNRLRGRLSFDIENFFNNEFSTDLHSLLRLETRLYSPIRDQLNDIRAKIADEIWVKIP